MERRRHENSVLGGQKNINQKIVKQSLKIIKIIIFIILINFDDYNYKIYELILENDILLILYQISITTV